MRLALVLLLAGCGTAAIAPAPDSGPPDDTGAPNAPHLSFVVRGAELQDGARALYSEPTAIRVTGLAPNTRATITLTEKQRDTAFTSSARFVAVDGTFTTADAPLDGSYTGADIDGLIWSSAQTDASDLARNDLRAELSIDGMTMATATLGRDFSPPGAMRVAVSDNGLVGAFYAPADGKKHPAILAFGGSEGGLSGGETYAAYWAARGFAALGVAYFGAPGLPPELTRIPLEYFDRAMQWLDGRAEADTSKLWVMGGSRGGELALLLGASFPRISGVVAYVPSGVLWGGPDGFAEVASWTKNGMDLPFVPYGGANPTTTVDTNGDHLVHYRPVFESSIANASPSVLDAATSRVELTNGPVLLLAGADDQIWPSCTLAKLAMDRLTSAGHDKKWPDALHCYEGAGHNVYFPGLSTLLSYKTPDPYSKQFLALGGAPAGIAHASRAADDAVRTLLGL